MSSYARAKRLKDAGWPQPRFASGDTMPGEWVYEPGAFPKEDTGVSYSYAYSYDPVYDPTLDELIDGCGEHFSRVCSRVCVGLAMRVVDKNGVQEDWRAVAYLPSEQSLPTEIEGWGATPKEAVKEAVAELWLAWKAAGN
jgi:hypothetical protein